MKWREELLQVQGEGDGREYRERAVPLTDDDPQDPLHEPQPPQPPPHLLLVPLFPLPRRHRVSLQAQSTRAVGQVRRAAGVRRLAREEVEVDGGLGAPEVVGVDERLGGVRVVRGRRLERDGRDRGQMAVVRVWPAAVRRAVGPGPEDRRGRRRGRGRVGGEDGVVEEDGSGHAGGRLGAGGRPTEGVLGVTSPSPSRGSRRGRQAASQNSRGRDTGGRRRKG